MQTEHFLTIPQIYYGQNSAMPMPGLQERPKYSPAERSQYFQPVCKPGKADAKGAKLFGAVCA